MMAPVIGTLVLLATLGAVGIGLRTMAVGLAQRRTPVALVTAGG